MSNAITGISRVDINDILNEIEVEKRKFTVDLPTENKLVSFSFSAQDSFTRFEAIKSAQDILRKTISNTGGHMSSELIDAYEGLNVVMEKIKNLELDLVKFGR